MQGDLATGLRVGDLPDLSHAPPLTEAGGHGVVPEASAGTQRHAYRPSSPW